MTKPYDPQLTTLRACSKCHIVYASYRAAEECCPDQEWIIP